MPKGPLAHVCFMVKDLDKSIEDWRKILQVVDPGQLVEPIVRMDAFEAGGDVMSWATFVNPNGCEIQLMQPISGRLRERLDKRGEGVHHIAFCRPDLPEVIEKLDEGGVKLTSKELSQDPVLPWQAWTFISPESASGLLVELAYAYKSVNGHWEKA
jgi:catechol 2,3-dioxygenase-like lactoylglutathione lyase family enzyme